MEDALVQIMEKKNVIESLSLNPCFNGRCTSTGTYKEGESKVIFVLILVLMEDALVQRTFNYKSRYKSLNPCFNGRCTSTHRQRYLQRFVT